MLFLIAELTAVALTMVRSAPARAAQAPAGQGFTVTAGDLGFILKQIHIAEHHAATLTATNPCGTLVGSGPDQIPDRLTSYGLRTVDGSCNNLFPARERYAAADEVFPRLTSPHFRKAESRPAGFFGPGSPEGPQTDYGVPGDVYDSRPRLISNLIVDQTSENPAAVAAARVPVRSQDSTPSAIPCDPGQDPVVDALGNVTTPGVPAGCTPSHSTLFIPNVTTDVGLSPPYNSVFTFFGQFFDHGVDQTVKSGAAVFIPLRDGDPLIAGPDHILGNADDLPASKRFMVLTRAQNQPGNVQEATNTDTPLVDQSQTYTSHASHQLFLREYDLVGGKPVDTGKMLGNPERANLGPDGLPNTGDDVLDPSIKDTGMSTWKSVKEQAKTKLGILLKDTDVTNIPLMAVDPYGNYLPGPDRGLPQIVTATGMVEGNLDAPVEVPANARHFDTPFVTDIAHNADPTPTPPSTTPLQPDGDDTIQTDFTQQPAGTYDNELLDTHFTAGDGRVNENIALSAVHQIFHSEHDRLVDDIKNTLDDPANATLKAQYQAVTAAHPWNYGQRLFQAARFVTEMEYQHLVFEEFARKLSPNIRPFHLYHTDMNPVIPAEFAHAVYRFGHSMLDDDVARFNEDPTTGAKTDNSLKLLDAFLNPPSFFAASKNQNPNAPNLPKYTPAQAAGAIFMGSSDQPGNELDEFVTETLRNNLLGLPLDLPTINMARARETGIPPLNEVRRKIFASTHDGQMAPYSDWSDYGQHLKHPESLVNYIAAYGTHPTILAATTRDEKRAAAQNLVDPPDPAAAPSDAADFMFSTGAWAPNPDGSTTTGLDEVDLWVGGLGEVTNLFGGLLGSTFNYVFQNTLENLQDGDRLYYLARTPGLNLRTQLEGNSFSELVQRNTDNTHSLKADAFGTADCRFELGRIVPADATDAIQSLGAVHDDPNSDCDENALLLLKPDGTVQYRARNTVNPPGINGQGVYNGTPGVDKVVGGNDNDTFWGGLGNDIIEVNGGDDVALGGGGNDIITDLDGADILEGGDGNDALDGGTGDDLLLGGNGSDVTDGGSLDNETFAGPGSDFMQLGQGADVGFGDGGDDWMQGGSGQDLLQGDHGAPFFDDPGEGAPGNEIMVGEVGENDYDAEGGDDLMSQNQAIDRNAGAGGFDWAFHQYDTGTGPGEVTTPANDDMQINNQLAGLPLPIVVNRDRWQETEGDSGTPFDDIIRGDDFIPSTQGGAGFSGCDALDATGVGRIAGLETLVTPAVRAATGKTGADVVKDVNITACPLDPAGPIWGEGNIILGGAGSDLLEGRGGDDIIDGDKALSVRISVRDGSGPTAVELGSTDLLQHTAKSGSFGPGTDGMTLEEAVFAGKVDPGNLVMVREITTPTTTASTTDTAVFSGNSDEYTFTQDGSTLVVNHTGGAATDGVDRLTNVERLQFADVTLNNGVGATVTTSLEFGSRAVTTAPAITQDVTVTNNGLTPMTLSAIALVNPVPATPAQFTIPALTALPAATCRPIPVGGTCTIPVTFLPTAVGAKSATLRISSTSLPGGSTDVPLSGTGVTNRAATGTPTITGTPAVGQVLTVNTAAIADLDGLGPFTIQWQASPSAAFPAAQTQTRQTGPSTTYTVQNVDRGQVIRAVVTFVDGFGTTESRASAATARVPGAAGPPAAAAQPAATPLGQALAPQTGPTAVVAASAPTGTRGTLAVSRSASALTVTISVPAGTRTAQISVFALNAFDKRTSAGAKARMRHIATVFRKTTAAKRYVFRLTDKRFRNLKPGRYLVRVRVGPSRAALGPAMTREITIKRSRSKALR